MRFHWQNLNDKPAGRQGSGLRHGRCWFHFGQRPCLGIEWVLLRWGLAVGFDIDSEDATVHVKVPGVALYLTLSGVSWARRDYRKGDRELYISVYDKALWWNFWTPGMEWSCETPRWRNGAFHPADFFLGRPKFTERELESVETVVPMPERSYPATVKLSEYTWKRPRWKALRRVCAQVEIPGGIPHPGKGENSWDCGDDATYGLSCGASTVPDAVSAVVASVLKSRERYGGRSWSPQPEEAPVS